MNGPSRQVPWDVLVMGSGAAGLMAGIRAARRGSAVLVLEKNARPGRKILASGGGRCNLTTTLTGAALERAFPERQGSFLRFALRAFTPQRLRAFFADEGVPTHAENWEKVFPDAGRASVVLDALVRALDTAGGRLLCGHPVTAVSRQEGGGFEVGAGGEVFSARRVVLAMGGRSYQGLGTTGDGYDLATSFGHRIAPLHPALVGLTLGDESLRSLAGVTVEDAVVELLEDERVAQRERRPLLFTHKGLSGPGPMNVSRRLCETGSACLRIDYHPAQSFQDLERSLLTAAREHPKARVPSLLPHGLPGSLRRYLVAAADIPEERSAGVLTRDERRRLLHVIKGQRLRVDGTLGWERAEVTRGGICLDEIDSRTMESKKVPGLHVVGEVLDVDGPIGGFNFQAAFATGYLAGETAGGA